MATGQYETEDKYDVAATTALPPLGDLPGVATVDVSETLELRSTYFDTEDLSLLRAGITLRRRTGGHDEGWHLKLPAGRSRQEVHLPLSRARKSVPKELRDTVRAVVRDRPMSAVVDLRNRRTEHLLMDASGGLLATVADDLVETDDSSWHEWEVELDSGGQDLLDAAGRLLMTAGAKPSRTRSKLARALGDRLPSDSDPWRSVGSDTSAAELLQARFATQVERMRRLDPRVRRDVPDAVHQMRVAIRRLHGALGTFRPLFDRTSTEPVREELAWLSGVLGEARDSEVIHDRLRRLVSAEAAELVRGDVAGTVDTEMDARYSAAHERALAALDSPRYFALLDRLDELVASPPWNDAGSENRPDALGRRIRHDWKRLQGRVDLALRATDPAERAERLHGARKAAKRLRYAAETAVPVSGKPARRFVKSVKRVQSTLGEHHDAVVTQGLLADLADRTAAEGGNAFTFGVLHAREEQAARGSEAESTKAWRKASKRKRRRWFT